MPNELITLNSTLSINNETVESTKGNSLINYFVSVAVLAEMAISKGNDFPWLIEEKLFKRRNSYEFDKHLQSMLLFLDGKNRVSAKCIACSSSGYYITEVILDSNIYVHFCRRFDKTAKYNQPYLLMNEDPSRFGFCCFEYTLSADKTKVIDISLVIPRFNKADIKVKLPIDFKSIRDRFTTTNEPIKKRLEALNWHQEQEDASKSDNTAQ